METFLLLLWVAMIGVSYKAAVMALDKANLL